MTAGGLSRASECGECDSPEQMAWDPINDPEHGPVIRCCRHLSLAPGWAYECDGLAWGFGNE